jgi:hypothetical protein
VALAAFCVQLAVVGQQSLKNYLRGGYFAGLQGRYLYAFVGVVAALVAVGLARVVPRRVLPLVALAAVVVLQAVGALTALDGFWWPEGEGVRRALAVQAAWAPFPRAVSLLAVLVPWRARCCWRRGWSPTVLLPRCGGDPRSTLLWPGAGLVWRRRRRGAGSERRAGGRAALPHRGRHRRPADAAHGRPGDPAVADRRPRWRRTTTCAW